MKTTMSNVDEHNLIVSTEAELPKEVLFGTMALIIETGELKIFDKEWKSI